jgi:methylglutaconyl-CoA hydratase
MDSLLTEQHEHIYILTLNRVEKRNAFDDALLEQLNKALHHAETTSDIRVVVIKANGHHFSAGADLNWMKRMVTLSETENRADALRFAHILHKLYQCPKPTIALVHGASYGGGIGLIAACDIAIAADNATFCFSEVTLGLVPAVISPYVIKAIGERAAKALFLSAKVFTATHAAQVQLIHHCVPSEHLSTYGLTCAQRIATFSPQAVEEAKALARHVSTQPINDSLLTHTAELIAKLRVSPEAQDALHLFIKQSHG